jgi:hypothetical protein
MSGNFIAFDIALRACKAALSEALIGRGDLPAHAWRSYVLNEGLLKCTATFDGEKVVTSWDIDGCPLSRAGAETKITARMLARFKGELR